MKLQDLKTIDEVYEFGKAAKFYKVMDYYPFNVEEVVPFENLQVSLDCNKKIYWKFNGTHVPSSVPLFDNFNEAKKLSLKNIIEYNKVQTATAKKELKELKLKGDAQ